jgi:hypothetical protein
VSLPLYTRVLWRFRFLVTLGFLLATLLAIVSYAHVHLNGRHLQLTPRKAEVWSAEARLFVTSPGFPWGTTTQEYATTNGGPVPIGDPTRLASLAVLYSDFASRDAVRQIALRDSPVKGKISAEVETTLAGTPTQVIDLQAAAATEHDSVVLAGRAVKALQVWVAGQQRAAGTPKRDRVLVQLLTKPAKPMLIVPRKKTLSIVAFIAVMTAFIGLAFVLENMRPSPESLIERHTAPAPEPTAATPR